MLYEIFRSLGGAPGALNLLRYESVRASIAFLVAFLVAIFAGGPLIRLLRRRKIGEEIKSDSAEVQALHAAKAGTPTMGGLLILVALLAGISVGGRLDNFYVLTAIFTTLALGIVGMIDDWVS